MATKEELSQTLEQLTKKRELTHINIQRLEQEANTELNPKQTEVAKTTAMKTAIDSGEVDTALVSKQRQDELLRQFKDRIATQQATIDSRLAYYRARIDIEKKDLEAINKDIEKTEATLQVLSLA